MNSMHISVGDCIGDGDGVSDGDGYGNNDSNGDSYGSAIVSCYSGVTVNWLGVFCNALVL